MSASLACYPVTHGGLRKVMHPRLGMEIDNQTCVRYLRFARPVRIDHLELPHAVYGRWTPSVPTHPAHLILSIPDATNERWKLLKEVDLPYDPRIAGEGLIQEMELEKVEAFFAAILKEPPLQIDLEGVQTDLLRVECDREYLVWPNHGECNGSPYSVPFGILNGLTAFGDELIARRPPLIYLPGLRQISIKPAAPEGMQVNRSPLGLVYSGSHFSVGFSLTRPMLTHLGWDALGSSQAKLSRLKADWAIGIGTQVAGLSGPLLRTPYQDFGAQNWSGEVLVKGNRVEYRNLHVLEGLSIDACFTVYEDGMTVEIDQTITQAIAALEFEAWRFVWDMRKGMTATAAKPTCEAGRNGRVTLPVAWASDGVGCLVCVQEAVEGDAWLAQVESYRDASVATCGFTSYRPVMDDLGLIKPGKSRLKVQIKVDAFKPEGFLGTDKLSEGLARHWGSIFSCFRPEHRGFSNNATSVNCHLSQMGPGEIAATTARLACGLDPAELSRFTLQRALADGGGYGYWRNLYLDSDPSLLIATGRLHQTHPDLPWLRSVEPAIREVTRRILAERDEQGLIVCRDLSGNSGSYRWSCNSMDVVGFGYLDAYVNAMAYRGLRCAAGMYADLGDRGFAEECRQAARQIHSEYAQTFLNPQTGWVAGWRSRDGNLHDYGFTWVNGPAIAFGLLAPSNARQALLNLEKARKAVGATEGSFGLPSNFYPIDPADHMMPLIWGTLQATFENYTDGGYYGMNAAYYLRALSIYGLKPEATRLAHDLLFGLTAGYFNGGMGSGNEFRTWNGLCTGYEGTLIGNFAPVYALAIESGVLKPLEPEWWPAGG